MKHLRSNKEWEEIEMLRQRLDEANETIEAIRKGEVDALVVEGQDGHELYTLRSADRTYRTFIEQMSEGALTVNADGIILYCNSTFAKMVGFSSEQVISNHLREYIAPSDQSRFHELIRAGWNSDVKGEVFLRRPHDVLSVQLSITSLDMDEGTALSIIVTDLSVQKENLKVLKQYNDQLVSMNLLLEVSNHDLQQFASVASHDLQEPLRKIQVFSHLMREKFSHELSGLCNDYLNKIVHAANRMKALVIDILNYSRLSSNERHYVRTDIRAIIDELLVDLELVIKEKKARIIVGELPEIEINSGQMRQVFQNLISNALKFSRKGVPPVVEIFSSDRLTGFVFEPRIPKPYCHIHIRDNGIGFDEMYAASIFNLFEKLHSKDDYDGSGIGLAITKKIVEKHHGQIHVRSTENVGTEFIISLPVNQSSSD